MIQNKISLVEEILNRNTNIIGKDVHVYDLVSMIFYHSHSTKTTVNGLRLTSYGYMVLSTIYTPYVYGDKCTVTSHAIITMVNHLNGPWFYDNGKLAMFDKKDYAKLNLYGDFDMFIKSYNKSSN